MYAEELYDYEETDEIVQRGLESDAVLDAHLDPEGIWHGFFDRVRELASA